MAAIGKPFQGMDYMIASPSGKPLPAGETGELWIAGPQLMNGYWCAPEKTAECFVTDSSGKLYYRTGDLCLTDTDGDIMYCGRKDTQVKIQGFRIELGEIEYHVKTFYKHSCNAVVLPVYTTDGSCGKVSNSICKAICHLTCCPDAFTSSLVFHKTTVTRLTGISY